MPKKLPEIKVEMLAAALASGRALVSAAGELGISESTGRRWKSDPSFDRRVIRIRAQIRSQTIGRYVSIQLKGADVLEALLESPDGELRLKALALVNRDLAVMFQGTAEAVASAPGLVVPNLDPRWSPASEVPES